MRGVYQASIRISGFTGNKTVIYITAPASKVVEILGASITNESNETNEQFYATFQRITTLGTPTATTLTPSKAEAGDQAAGSTVKGNVTASEPTYTANTEVGIQAAGSLQGWYYDPIPEERLYVEPSGNMGLRMLTTVTAFDAVGTVRFREIG
jgi:hypothetical protein